MKYILELEKRIKFMEGVEQKAAGKGFDNNSFYVYGRMIEEFQYSHTWNKMKFFKSRIAITREDGKIDGLSLVVSQDIRDKYTLIKGRLVNAVGILQPFTNKLTLWAKYFCAIGESSTLKHYDNIVHLKCWTSELPSFRTELGNYITDMTVSVSRSYNSSSTIQCMLYSRAARFAEGVQQRTPVEIWGRIESSGDREYISVERIRSLPKQAEDLPSSKIIPKGAL